MENNKGKSSVMRYLTAIFFLLVFLQCISQPSVVMPKDESSRDPALVKFITQLKEKINAKDFHALLNYIHPEIQIGFDGNNGKDAFIEEWRSSSNQTKLWPIIKRIIDLGGVFVKEDPKNLFVFPYAYEIELGAVEDAYDLFIVTGKNVNIREKPTMDAKVRGQLSYHIVTRDHSGRDQVENEWQLINSLDKKMHGFVHKDYLYSPSDYRLFLKKENGHWMIYMFLVGD